MQDDANEVPRDTTVRADVCIVGAGAAGITLARELAGSRHDVVLLESGGFEFDDLTQSLYEGSASGIEYHLDESRLRFFGGSTNHWAGQSRPLDQADFEARDWVPNSGWPFGLDTLLPYYEQAQPMCDLGPFRYDAKYWVKRIGGHPVFVEDNDVIRTAIFQIGGGTRFGTKYRKAVTGAANVRVLTNANVTNVRVDGARAAGVDVQTLDGNQFRVDAPVVVLATGGIENARLLLASRDASPAGVGNDRDLVGRYFMDHSIIAAGRVVLSDQAPDPAFHFFTGISFSDAGIPEEDGAPGRTVLGAFALTAEAAAAARIPAWSAILATPGPAFGDQVDDHDVLQLARDIEGRSTERRRSQEITVYGGDVRQASDRFDLLVSMEPTPNPDSRLTLTDELDALGMPRADLNWAITSDDFQSIERGIEVLGRELGRAGVARVYRAEAEDVLPIGYGSHQMGTTRMHADPSLGVVDANGEVHGVAGLFIGGSSVFPSVGFSNPTLTIVALALRMADHLEQVLAP